MLANWAADAASAAAGRFGDWYRGAPQQKTQAQLEAEAAVLRANMVADEVHLKTQAAQLQDRLNQEQGLRELRIAQAAAADQAQRDADQAALDRANEAADRARRNLALNSATHASRGVPGGPSIYSPGEPPIYAPPRSAPPRVYVGPTPRTRGLSADDAVDMDALIADLVRRVKSLEATVSYLGPRVVRLQQREEARGPIPSTRATRSPTYSRPPAYAPPSYANSPLQNKGGWSGTAPDSGDDRLTVVRERAGGRVAGRAPPPRMRRTRMYA